MPWTDYTDKLEWHFSPNLVSGESREPAMAARDAASAKAIATLNPERNIRYGTGPRQLLDFFPAPERTAGNGKVIHVYVHGGFWRQGHKDTSSYVAPASVQLGLPTVVLGYDLCPEVTLEQLTAQVLDGIAWVYRNSSRLGVPGAKVFISGHSAGAHLCAMALACDWTSRGVPPDFIVGAALSSGIYDIGFVPQVTLNEVIELTPDRVKFNSPIFNPPLRPLPVIIFTGGKESPGWINQTDEYVQVLRSAGCAVTVLEFPEDNHSTLGMAAHGDVGSLMMRGIAATVGIKR